MVFSSIRRKFRALRAGAPDPESSSGPLVDIAKLSEVEYRAVAQRPALDLFKLGTRMFSYDAVDQLAAFGTREECAWHELEARLHNDTSLDFPPHWDLSHVLAAAILQTVIDFSDATLRTAAIALRRALPHPQLAEALADTRLRLFAFQVPLYAGEPDLFEELSERLDSPEDVAWVARVESHRAKLGDEVSAVPASDWWRGIGEPFVASEIEPWDFDAKLDDADLSWFDRIHAPVVSGCAVAPEDQPLVTVIVPAYNPCRSIVNTIESLARQSWSRLEILLIDDASPHGGDLIDTASALDERVRLIRLEQNSGAYHARNTGLQAAKGEFVTVLDADDLAHPRRIERQIAPLLTDPGLMATASHAIRLYGDGRMLTYGATALRRNASSLLFRREPALAELGLYDRVYKAADTEYILRMQLRFGKRSVKHMKDALGLIQLTDGSLSRGDFRNGWWSGRRVAYRHQYLTWHQLALRSDSADFLVTTPATAEGHRERRFTAPRTFLKQPELEHLNVGMLADWSARVEQPEGWARLIPEIATVHAPDPCPVGLLHGVDQRRSAANRDFIVSRDIWESVENGTSTWISWDQSAHIDTLIVMSADTLVLLPSPKGTALSVGRVIVLTEVAPQNDWLADRVQRVFGVQPEWVPPSGLLRTLARDAGANA